MPKYAARVRIPRPSHIDDTMSYEEVMIDSIKASSQRKATKIALAEARHYIGYNMGWNEEPEILDVARLDKNGVSVKKTFDATGADVRWPSITNSKVPDSSAKPPDKKSKPVTTAVRYTSLADPFTEDIISLVTEKGDKT